MSCISKKRKKEKSLRALWSSNLSLVGKLLRSPLRLIPANLEVRVLSGINKGKRWIVGAGIDGYWIGNFEQDKQRLLEDRIKTNMCVWDVGAHAGFYTLAFSSRVGSGGRVTAFEPFAENVCILMEHLELNRVDNVTIVQAIASSDVGISPFLVSERSSMGSISKELSGYSVPTIRLDDYALSSAPPDVIKIDVEGAEAEVLKGSVGLLNTARPELWIAFHGECVKAESVNLLGAVGYVLYDLEEKVLTYPFVDDEVIAKPREEN
jgi:FkbM family methyltransferase